MPTKATLHSAANAKNTRIKALQFTTELMAVGLHFEGHEMIAHCQEDFWYWHRGRNQYAVWVIDINDARVDSRVSSARQQLTEVLWRGYQRQLHVTLGVCGFPCIARRYGDDFLPDDLSEQLLALQAASLLPFSIEIGGLDSFASAPFLRILDCDQGIASVRDCLRLASREHDAFRYIAHLTVGLYDRVWPRKRLCDLIDGFTSAAPLRYEVRCLQWVTYVSTDSGGLLRVAGVYDLDQNRWQWLAGSPFV